MNASSRFKCPACGFAVFNRRVARCESCAAALPPDLLFSPEQVSFLATEHRRNDKARENLAREADEAERQRVRRRGDGG